MSYKNQNVNCSRRSFLGWGLMSFFLPSNQAKAAPGSIEQEELIVMLNAEGKAVKVRKAQLSGAKVIKKKLPNQLLLNWLKPNGKPKN